VLRVITTTIPKFEDLKLPPVLKDVAMTKRGLVLFVGGTGSGKSTSLAAMIGYRNANSHGHIITIEDPVEYVHPHVNCLITQREVGVDTDSWEAALKNTLRQAPGRDPDRRDPRHGSDGARHRLRRDRATWRSARCTPTTPTRRWTGSSTSSPRRGASSC
jgi:ABC-type nitrate/sulfonate/bicarbonate transport system ATPase subunit